MCGLAGVVSPGIKSLNHRIQAMTDRIMHRGPDGHGYWVDGEVAFGHRRLSIIDLKTGQQPMVSACGRYVIVFNGEIYNYVELMQELQGRGSVFRTNSDTEVVLNAYAQDGPKCVKSFYGMFAFAIWDKEEHSLFCARDRLGMKPFYYTWNGDRLLFASEIKALLEDPEVSAQPNLEAIAEYLSFQFTLSDQTFFAGIHKLKSGHFMLLQQGSLTIEPYWSPTRPIDTHLGEAEAADRLRKLLHESVRIHLRSDVALGCHLSGGVDSSTVAALATAISPERLQSFTGKFSQPPGYDESPYARTVAQELGMDYFEVEPPLDDLLPVWRKLVWHMDEPTAGPGVLPQYYVSELASRHVKVVLGGQGGDELFGGYEWYAVALFIYLVKRLGFGSVFGFREDVKYVTSYVRRHGLISAISSLVKSGLAFRWSEIYYSIWSSNAFAQNELRSLLANRPLAARGMAAKVKVDRPTEMFEFDLQHYLPSLLMVEDRTSMAVSLESRLPLLDHRIVELALSLPLGLRLRTNGQNKYVLRGAVQDITPNVVLARKDKKGFPTPLGAWLRRDGGVLAKDLLVGPESRTRGELFQADYVQRLLNEHLQGQDRSRKLWLLLNVEFWYRTFIDPDETGRELLGLGSRSEVEV